MVLKKRLVTIDYGIVIRVKTTVTMVIRIKTKHYLTNKETMTRANAVINKGGAKKRPFRNAPK